MLIALLFPGRKVYLPGGYRWHHGHSGLALLACGICTGSRRLITAGALLCLDDILDVKHWTRLPVHRRYETA